ncbi:immunity protein Tsi6 family protein [Neisseria montereyensis]|uniref:Immunity protein Tsi6 family protein n=1 Tax=Neisseria montereyensis TaxID=2973938 RepID=A0ABT2FCF3_9NEIS|nr:immunity protein Tsi6 family protein [Neisseria montereyensis]MCS4533827.1 immunity protein Tsi6 family protein [Neisseria montereyensis]
MEKIEAIKLVEKTLEKSFEYFSTHSDWQPIVSTREQLNYILDTLHQKNDGSKLDEITIGLYAVKEFEVDYKDFANLIYEVVEIIELIKKQSKKTI